MGHDAPKVNLNPSSISSGWGVATHPFDGSNNQDSWAAVLGGGIAPRNNSAFDAIKGIINPQKPDLQTPGHVPTQGEANQTALGQELGQEQQMHSTWNILTGGQGVLDTPQTAGPTLLGS